MKLRKSDSNELTANDFPRSSRFKETARGWYFITREGEIIGPYATLFDAELSASLLISRLAQLDDETNPKTLINEFRHDPFNPIIKPDKPKPKSSQANSSQLPRKSKLMQSVRKLISQQTIFDRSRT